MTLPGKLDWMPALDHPELLAPSVNAALSTFASAGEVFVAPIDPALADTAAFCERYDVGPDVSANCVVVAGKRDGEQRIAGCVILATARADVNGAVRRRLDVRKASFLAVSEAVDLTAMEYGGITPIGLPGDWPLLVDAAVVSAGTVVIGSGIRASKLALSATALAELPGAEVLDGLARPSNGG